MRILFLLLTSIILFAQPLTITSSMTMLEFSKLKASDAAENNYFGSSVAISGDTVVVGAYGDDDGGSDSGSVYIYLLNHSNGLFEQQATLSASDATGSDYFGHSVAISGDTVVVGAFGDDDADSRSGSAYLFEKPISGWVNATEDAKLIASDAALGDSFGYSVAISGDTVAIGAIGDKDSGTDSGSAYLFKKPALGWVDATEDAKLRASDGAAHDYFGISVAISGDTVVVGAHQDDNGGSDSGSAYLFKKPTLGWTNATEDAKLRASDAAERDYFGRSVAISGDTVVVGAHQDDDGGSDSGSAYLFEKPISGWTDATEDAKLRASDATEGDYFGISVAISGNTVVVGASGDDNSGNTSGSAYLFEKPGSGGWADSKEDAKLGASDAAAYDTFGISVAISGDTVVVGAYGDDRHTGSAYCFKPGLFQNTLENKQDIIDIEAVDSNNHSISFSIIGGDDASHFSINPTSGLLSFNNAPDYETPLDENGDNIYKMILKVNDTFNESSIYPAFIRVSDLDYEDEAPKAIGFKQLQKLSANTPSDNQRFGYSVVISGDTAVIGTVTEVAYIYILNHSSGLFEQQATLSASDAAANDFFGYTVAISGDTVVVGAYLDDDSGSAYVFEKPALGWADATENAKLRASGAVAGDYFGRSVAISGDTIIVGSPNDDDSGHNSGSAYLFEKPTLGWIDATEDVKLRASNAAGGDYFGRSVAISGDTVIVGAYGDDDIIANSGSAYLFEKPPLGWADATEDAKLRASNAAEGDNFGFSVAISGDIVVVGAYVVDSYTGSAYLFEKPPLGWTDANENAVLMASDAAIYDSFGYSVAISGDTVVVGAQKGDESGSGSGSAYLFEKPALGWVDTTEDAILVAPDTAVGDNFGSNVAISGDTVIVGAYLDDDGEFSNSGASYVFKATDALGASPAVIMYLLD